MTRDQLRTIGSVVMVTGVLGILLAVRPLPAGRLLAGYVVALAAIALLHLVRSFRGDLRPPGPSRFDAALAMRKKPADGRPLVFMVMEREIEQSISHAGVAHRRLLPLLRSAAAARLQQHGIELRRNPGAARELLGDRAWELLRPDRPAPADPFSPGLTRETVVDLVERVEVL